MVMKALAVALLLGTLLAPYPGEAKQSRPMPRVGFLIAGMPSPLPPPLEQGLRDLGWVEGQNVVFEPRFAEGRLDRLPALAQELVQMKVDMIVTVAGSTIRPAFEATRTIPIVMIGGSADPVGDGFAASLAHPGGNVTGVTWSAGPELVGKNLQLLKEVVPKLSRVALLYDGIINPTALRGWEDAAKRLGLRVELSTIREPAELEPTIAAISQAGADAMCVVLSGINYSRRERIAALALARRLPTFSTVRELPVAGGLMSYGPTTTEILGRGAIYVDKILRGARPSDLPIEQPTKFELVINLRTASALGLVVPSSLLRLADHLIK